MRQRADARHSGVQRLGHEEQLVAAGARHEPRAALRGVARHRLVLVGQARDGVHYAELRDDTSGLPRTCLVEALYLDVHHREFRELDRVRGRLARCPALEGDRQPVVRRGALRRSSAARAPRGLVGHDDLQVLQAREARSAWHLVARRPPAVRRSPRRSPGGPCLSFLQLSGLVLAVRVKSIQLFLVQDGRGPVLLRILRPHGIQVAEVAREGGDEHHIAPVGGYLHRLYLARVQLGHHPGPQ
mmetsp:Transcript_2196/g.5696  ORF Transcript_2196/g.5696 Transcript_2196/m.5696 type:complete len:243 (+) Transcript_2196:598-1326(+)